jgi:hypothetical protein
LTLYTTILDIHHNMRRRGPRYKKGPSLFY